MALPVSLRWMRNLRRRSVVVGLPENRVQVSEKHTIPGGMVQDHIKMESEFRLSSFALPPDP